MEVFREFDHNGSLLNFYWVVAGIYFSVGQRASYTAIPKSHDLERDRFRIC